MGKEQKLSLKEKKIPASGSRTPRGAEGKPLVERRARWVGALLTIIGAALMVLSAVLGGAPL
jgi:hypothetical protein